MPRGVDYEDSQERLHICNSFALFLGTGSGSAVAEPTIVTTGEGIHGCNKRKRGNDIDGRAATSWRSANAFRSIPPECAAEAANGKSVADMGNDKDINEGMETLNDFGGMQLMPLEDRPYFRDGFVRLPAMPIICKERRSLDRHAEEECFLDKLQSTPQISRFDSLHSLRHGCPSVSQVVIFRRTRDLGNP